MRILVTSSGDINRTNPFIPQLVRALAAHPDVETVLSGNRRFWDEPVDVDVVHQHWPEDFFGWARPTDEQLGALRRQLERWRERAPIVVTVHNYGAHYRDDERMRRLYALVYASADGFIHRGQASVDDFAARFPELAGRPLAIIPPGESATFANTVSQDEARDSLGVPRDARVFLSLSRIRHFEELGLMFVGFRALRLPGKRLLVSTRSRRRDLEMPLLERLRLRLDARILLNTGFIPPDRVQYWVNAADVVVIPRVKPLNSAGLSLGFSFGKVVAGPDSGVVGEILRATGNPTFDLRDRRSVASALARASALAADGLGARNRLHAERHWNWSALADRHVAFFRDVAARAAARR